MSNVTTGPNSTAEFEKSYMTFFLVIISVKGFSATYLALLIFIYVRRREFKTISGKNVISFSGSLLASYSLDILNTFLASDMSAIPCIISAVLTNLLLLASFLWVSVMAFDIMYTITRMQSSSSMHGESSRYIKYSVFVWLVDLSIWTAALLIDRYELVPETFRPNFENAFCDIINPLATGIYIYAPEALTIVANLIMFIITMRAIIQIKRLKAQVDIRQNKRRFCLYVKLAVVMGGLMVVVKFAIFLGWFLPYNITNFYITAVPDSLFGFFIFLHFAFKSPSWKSIKKCFIRCFSCCFSKGWLSRISLNEGSSELTFTTESSNL